VNRRQLDVAIDKLMTLDCHVLRNKEWWDRWKLGRRVSGRHNL